MSGTVLPITRRLAMLYCGPELSLSSAPLPGVGTAVPTCWVVGSRPIEAIPKPVNS
jgi:hypothetical protein